MQDRGTQVRVRLKMEAKMLPDADFPDLNAGDLPVSFTLPAEVLKRLIDRTQFAISTEETRYYLNGIFLHATQSNSLPVLRAVATDGHRLARVEMPLPDAAKDMPGVIVPRKTVAELRRLVEGGLHVNRYLEGVTHVANYARCTRDSADRIRRSGRHITFAHRHDDAFGVSPGSTCRVCSSALDQPRVVPHGPIPRTLVGLIRIT